MDKKHLIRQQYFDLSAELNLTNSIKFKIKEIYFYTAVVNGEELLFAAISDTQKRSLCKKKNLKQWVALGNTIYTDLESRIAILVPYCILQPNLSKCIKLQILGPHL